MSFLHSFILGLIQGLGEFLPISSSAHLVIAPWLGNFPDPGLAFDVALHLGTLIAVVCYFWKDWIQIFTGAGKFVFQKETKQDPEIRFYFYLLIYLVVATIPGAIAGKLLEEWAETYLRSPLLVAFNMIVMGVILFIADKRREHYRDFKNINLPVALLIGASQAFALFPGVSRSGITITTALFLGLDRRSAARFSFLLATPITFGACLLKHKYILTALFNPQSLLGVVTAAVFGFLSIKYLMKLVQQYSYSIFVYYRWLFGITVFIIYFMRMKS